MASLAGHSFVSHFDVSARAVPERIHLPGSRDIEAKRVGQRTAVYAVPTPQRSRRSERGRVLQGLPSTGLSIGLLPLVPLYVIYSSVGNTFTHCRCRSKCNSSWVPGTGIYYFTFFVFPFQTPVQRNFAVQHFIQHTQKVERWRLGGDDLLVSASATTPCSWPQNVEAAVASRRFLPSFFGESQCLLGAGLRTCAANRDSRDEESLLYILNSGLRFGADGKPKRELIHRGQN